MAIIENETLIFDRAAPRWPPEWIAIRDYAWLELTQTELVRRPSLQTGVW